MSLLIALGQQVGLYRVNKEIWSFYVNLKKKRKKKEKNKPTALVAANSLLFTKYTTSLILVSLNF